MAGGIEWFRWHHGSVTDPKFGLIAAKAGARLCEVLALWACLLEAASAAEDRGNAGRPDFEALDHHLDIGDGIAKRIHEFMVQRGLIDGTTGRIAAWEVRQPKRERPDDDSTERTREHRARKRQGSASDATHARVTPGDAKFSQASPSGTDEPSETPRGEERREEERGVARAREPDDGPPPPSLDATWPPADPDFVPAGPLDGTPAAEPGSPYGAICAAIKAAGIGRASSHHARFRALVDAGAAAEEFTQHVDAALKATAAGGDAFAYLLGIVGGERTRAKALAGQVHQGAMPRAKSAGDAKQKINESLAMAERIQRSMGYSPVAPPSSHTAGKAS